MILILILVLILVLILLLSFFCVKSQKSNFINRSQSISFYNSAQASKFILDDDDNYIKNMSNYDLIARLNYTNNVTTNIYKIMSSKDMKEFTKLEKNILMKLTKSISKLPNMPNINFIKIGNLYECGFPHTRQNIIFIPYAFFLKDKTDQLNTLMHEYIHIYQRYNQKETELFLNKYGFKKIGNFSNLFPKEYKWRRSNPDIDENIWQSPNGELMFPIFSVIPPTNITNIKNDKMEHPYEWMAYTFSS